MFSIGILQDEQTSRFGCLARFNVGKTAVFGSKAFDQDLNLATGLFDSVHPCWNNPGVIKNQQVLGIDQVNDIAELTMTDTFVFT
jgi:hypothetical protein